MRFSKWFLFGDFAGSVGTALCIKTRIPNILIFCCLRLNLTTVCHLFFVRCFEDVFFKNGLNSLDVTIFKIFLLLYVDDIVLFADSKAELQTSLNVLYDYCQKWKLVGNTNKKKLMVFKKRIRLSNNLKFYYNNLEIEIVN